SLQFIKAAVGADRQSSPSLEAAVRASEEALTAARVDASQSDGKASEATTEAVLNAADEALMVAKASGRPDLIVSAQHTLDAAKAVVPNATTAAQVITIIITIDSILMIIINI